LERALFFFPSFESNSALAGYLDVQHIAVTITVKTKTKDDSPRNAATLTSTARIQKSLEEITQPFRLTDTESVYCPVKGTKSVTGYHHLVLNTTATATADPRVKVPTRQQQQQKQQQPPKIPKILHQQGKSRCVPSALYDINQQWKQHLLSGDDTNKDNNKDGEWSIYFHTEDAMARLFRAIIVARQRGGDEEKGYNYNGDVWSIIGGNEFPHLEQVVRNCVANGSFLQRLLWRFLCLYTYGGVYADLESAPSSLLSYYDNGGDSDSNPNSNSNLNTIIGDNRNDAILFLVASDNGNGNNNLRKNTPPPRGTINTNIMAVPPEHPLLFYAVQFLLYRITTDGYEYSERDGFDYDDKASQSRIVSDVLTGSLVEFLGHAGGEHRNNANTYGRRAATTYSGTDNRTVTIIGPAADSRSNDADFLQKILQEKPRDSPSSSGGGSGSSMLLNDNTETKGRSRSGLDEYEHKSRRKSPPSCLRKILADVSISEAAT